MKRLTNLMALVMLVSTNVLTPFSYAQVETPEVIPENEMGNVGEKEESSENNIKISENMQEGTGKNENISEDSENLSEKDGIEEGGKTSENIYTGGNIENIIDNFGESGASEQKNQNDKTSENTISYTQNNKEDNENGGYGPENSDDKSGKLMIQIDTGSENNTGLDSLIDDILYTGKNLSKEAEELTTQDIDTGNVVDGPHELSTFEKAFQEVAYAYYMRGPYLHYNVAKGKGHHYSPEETTSQDYNYMACALYVKNVYKELLGINLGYSDTIDRAYAEKYIGKRAEVIGFAKLTGNNVYWYDGTKDENGELIGINIEDLKKSDIINQLKIGDIFGYDGHVMLVYDFKYNEENGEKEDVYLIHATNLNKSYNVKSKIHGKVTVYDSTGGSSNLNIGHSPWSQIRYNKFDRNAISTEYGIHDDARVEGTISLQTMGDAANRETRKVLLFSGNTKDYSNYYYIIRLVTTNSEGKSILNFNGTYSKFQEISGAVEGNDYINTEIDYSDSVKSRLKYSKLYIEKTVDKEDNNIVEPNDELTYIIKIQNNSKKAYDGFIVKENIDTNLVEYLGTSRNNVQLNENQLQWNITGLNSGDEIIIEYTVKVKTGNIGKTIESTGMVENIPSGTIKNIIGKNTDKGEKIKQSYNNLSNNYTGKILINEVYKEIYGVDFGLDKIEINAKNESDTGGLIYFNNIWGSWNNWDNTKMGISKGSPYSKMVLNSYFNVLYKDNNDGKGIKAFDGDKDIIIPARYSLPAIAVRLNDPDKRADTIFPSNFQMGDILIYKNSNDIKYSWKNRKVIPTVNTYENGEYAYIYIDGKFVGINLGNDEIEGTEDDRNEFTNQYYIDKHLSGYTIEGSTSSGIIEMDGESVEFLQYQSLFGKDAYVILRPSLAIRSIEYELDGGVNNKENPSAFLLGNNIELKEPTKSGYVFSGWYTDSGYINQVTNVNELTDDTALYAKWVCNINYHKEGNNCISNTKKENCIPGTIDNGIYTVEKMDVTRNSTINDWNETPSCINFTCNTYYHKTGSICKANTDKNGNSVADETEIHHTLTIHYIDSKGRTVFDDYTDDIVQGATYAVVTQEKLHYTADIPIVSGIMGNKDIVIAVKYSTATADTNNNGIADEDENKYVLTINYVYNRGGEVSESISGEYLKGISYSITSPVITYYSANVKVVEGTMSGEDKSIIVTYIPINDRNKNGIADEEEEKNNYSGGGGHRRPNATNNNTINLNQHQSAGENQKNQQNGITKNISNEIYIKPITVKHTVVSNNPNYTKEFNRAYDFAKSNGITTTYSIEKAKLNMNITRIQMAKMLSNFAMNVLGKEPNISKGVLRFNDVTNKMNKDYDNAVTLAYQLGIMGINMKRNNFRPNDKVTRAEFVTALSRMLYGTQDGTGKSKYYEPHMAKLYDEGIITKTNPKMIEKRGYVMLMLMRSIE